jgi:CHASE3 domain sensor protein
VFHWNNLSIRTKVLGAFVAVLLVTIGIGIFGLLQASAINANAIEVRE